MIIGNLQSGAPCKVLSLGVRIINRKVVDQLKTTQAELVNDLKATRTTFTKNTTP